MFLMVCTKTNTHKAITKEICMYKFADEIYVVAFLEMSRNLFQDISHGTNYVERIINKNPCTKYCAILNNVQLKMFCV